ncbi:MAG: hypothetical protein ACTSRL_22745 [Candidatus Helarchaeota archaeon]
MEKWKICTLLLSLGFGITFFILSLTNSIHNLFYLSTENETMMIGIAYILATFILFYFFKNSKLQMNYPRGIFLGILLLIVGTANFTLKLLNGLIFSNYFLGSFLLGLLYLFFFCLLGIILILESYKLKEMK